MGLVMAVNANEPEKNQEAVTLVQFRGCSCVLPMLQLFRRGEILPEERSNKEGGAVDWGRGGTTRGRMSDVNG
jgi:hypothetical protein